MSIKKYKRGKQINSIDEMMKKEFVYVVHDDKEQIYNAGWFRSWQLMYANNLIVGGCVYEVIPNFEVYIKIGGGALKSGKDECAFLKDKKSLKEYLNKNLNVNNLHIGGFYNNSAYITNNDMGLDFNIFNMCNVLNITDFIISRVNNMLKEGVAIIDADDKNRDMMFVLNDDYDTFKSKTPKFIEKV